VLGELDATWHGLAAGREPVPAVEHTSFRRWSEILDDRAAALDTCDFWAAQLDGEDPLLGTRRVRFETDRLRDVDVSMSITDTDVTTRLLAANEPTPKLLARAAARTVTKWRLRRGQDLHPPLIALETHGRAETVADDADLSETVGLFTAIYPVRVPNEGTFEVPGDGIDYGLLRYRREDTASRLSRLREPQLLLNFLGRIHAGTGSQLHPDRTLLAHVSPLPEPDVAVRHELTVLAAVLGDVDAPTLGTQWRTLPEILSAEDIATLQSMWQDSLREVVS
jgi:mycobactin peptide synthetase MbtF